MTMEHRPFRPPIARAIETEGSHTRVLISTVSGMEIGGLVLLPPGLRTMDLLNRETEAFLPVTSATLAHGGQVEQTPFIAVNKTHIVTLRELGTSE